MPNFVLHITSHVYTYPSSGFLEKKEYYTSLLDRQGGTLQPLPLPYHLKGATEEMVCDITPVCTSFSLVTLREIIATPEEIESTFYLSQVC